MSNNDRKKSQNDKEEDQCHAMEGDKVKNSTDTSIPTPLFLEQVCSSDDKSILDIITNSPKPAPKIKQRVSAGRSLFSSKKAYDSAEDNDKIEEPKLMRPRSKYRVSIPIFIAKNNQVQVIQLNRITKLKIWQLHELQIIDNASNVDDDLDRSFESFDIFQPTDTNSDIVLAQAVDLDEFVKEQSIFSMITPLNFILIQEYKQKEMQWNTLIVYEVKNNNMFAEMAVRNGAALNIRIQAHYGMLQGYSSNCKFPNLSLCKCPKMKKVVAELESNPFGRSIDGVIIDAKYVDTSKCCFLPPKKTSKHSDEKITSLGIASSKSSNTTTCTQSEESVSIFQSVSCNTEWSSRAVLVFPPLYLSTKIKLHGKVEEEDILKLICGFCRGEVLPLEDAEFIVSKARELFISSPNVIDINIDDRGLIVVGDLHGNLQDMLYIFQEKGLPSRIQPYLFLGDFVDRGENCPEVILLAFALKICFPDDVHILRGNHESHSVNLLFEKFNQGWIREFASKYSLKLLDHIEDTFNQIPLVAIGNQKIAFVHGGIGAVNSVNAIRTLNRQSDVQTGGILSALLWSDPVEEPNGFSKSSRGVGIFNYGPDITEGFLKRNQFTHMIRSHTVVEQGYRLNHNKKVITVFSCSSYNSNPNQRGSILHITGDLEMVIWRFHSRYNISDLIPLK